MVKLHQRSLHISEPQINLFHYINYFTSSIATDSVQVLLIRFSWWDSSILLCWFSIENNRLTIKALPRIRFIIIQHIRFFDIFSFWSTSLLECLSDGIVCIENFADASLLNRFNSNSISDIRISYNKYDLYTSWSLKYNMRCPDASCEKARMKLTTLKSWLYGALYI